MKLLSWFGCTLVPLNLFRVIAHVRDETCVHPQATNRKGYSWLETMGAPVRGYPQSSWDEMNQNPLGEL